MSELEKPSEIKIEPSTPKGSESASHGGSRDNSGRKPKAIRWAQDIAAAEGKIVAALPRVIEGLIKAAENGDTSAARYLMDRVFGRVANQAVPVAEDIGLPMDSQIAPQYALNFGMARMASQYLPLNQEYSKGLAMLKEFFVASLSQEHFEAYKQKVNERKNQRKSNDVNERESEVDNLKEENEELRTILRELFKEVNTKEKRKGELEDAAE
jgi:hypothetical protein